VATVSKVSRLLAISSPGLSYFNYDNSTSSIARGLKLKRSYSIITTPMASKLAMLAASNSHSP
jgi:hypothetical protein